MKLEELRIGYWYNKKGVASQLTQEELREILGCGGEYNYEPIPLTEEWLLNFGFNKRSEQFGIRIDEYAYLNIYTDTFRYGLFDTQSGDDFKSYDNKIEYVHQLQNLYFALTGEELELK